MLDTVYGCGDSTQFYTLSNQSGPSLDLSALQINAATCNQDGAIKGITGLNVTGVPFVGWFDSLDHFAGNTYDLVNVHSGKYRLKFKDGGACDTIITDYYTVPYVGAIQADTSGRLVRESNCSGPTGSIQGITAVGADQWEWTDLATNHIVANTKDVFNLPPGTYQLTIRNNSGCSLLLPPVRVPRSEFASIGVTAVSAEPDFCFQGNGKVKINSFTGNPTSYQFHWTDSATGQMAGTGTEMNKLKAGTYYLYAKDTNQCEKMIYTHRVTGTGLPVIHSTAVHITDDHCDLQEGSISSLSVSGLYGPSTYDWYNENNQVVGNSLELHHAIAGTYSLKVTDGGVCTVTSPSFVVHNFDDALSPPEYEHLIIPRYSDAALHPINTAPGSFTLIGSPSQQSNNGAFTIKNVSSDTSVYISRTYGSCTSSPVKVNIQVVDKSYFAIPTAFTPNGDGKNDQLHVRVIGYIHLTYFRIYNRWGQPVFETRQLNDGWNGTFGGKLQDSGAYVCMAEGKDMMGNTITDRGSFVLIR